MIARMILIRQMQLILGRAFNESIRQVTSNCLERGRLLTHLWTMYMSIFEDLVSIITANRNANIQRMREESEKKILQMKVKAEEEMKKDKTQSLQIIQQLREQNRNLTQGISDLQKLLSQRERELFEVRERRSALEEDVAKLQGVLSNTLKTIERMDGQQPNEVNNQGRQFYFQQQQQQQQPIQQPVLQQDQQQQQSQQQIQVQQIQAQQLLNENEKENRFSVVANEMQSSSQQQQTQQIQQSSLTAPPQFTQPQQQTQQQQQQLISQQQKRQQDQNNQQQSQFSTIRKSQTLQARQYKEELAYDDNEDQTGSGIQKQFNQAYDTSVRTGATIISPSDLYSQTNQQQQQNIPTQQPLNQLPALPLSPTQLLTQQQQQLIGQNTMKLYQQQLQPSMSPSQLQVQQQNSQLNSLKLAPRMNFEQLWKTASIATIFGQKLLSKREKISQVQQQYIQQGDTDMIIQRGLCDYLIEEKNINGENIKVRTIFFPHRFFDVDNLCLFLEEQKIQKQQEQQNKQENNSIEIPAPLEQQQINQSSSQSKLQQSSEAQSNDDKDEQYQGQLVFKVPIAFIPQVIPQLIVEEKDSCVQCSLDAISNWKSFNSPNLNINKQQIEQNIQQMGMQQNQIALSNNQMNLIPQSPFEQEQVPDQLININEEKYQVKKTLSGLKQVQDEIEQIQGLDDDMEKNLVLDGEQIIEPFPLFNIFVINAPNNPEEAQNLINQIHNANIVFSKNDNEQTNNTINNNVGEFSQFMERQSSQNMIMIQDSSSFQASTQQLQPLQNQQKQRTKMIKQAFITPAAMIQILQVYIDLLDRIFKSVTELADSPFSSQCVVIIVDTARPFNQPQISIQGMSEVVRAISEGRFIDFSNPAYDGNKGKKSHHLNQSLLPAAAAKRRSILNSQRGPKQQQQQQPSQQQKDDQASQQIPQKRASITKQQQEQQQTLQQLNEDEELRLSDSEKKRKKHKHHKHHNHHKHHKKNKEQENEQENEGDEKKEKKNQSENQADQKKHENRISLIKQYLKEQEQNQEIKKDSQRLLKPENKSYSPTSLSQSQSANQSHKITSLNSQQNDSQTHIQPLSPLQTPPPQIQLQNKDQNTNQNKDNQLNTNQDKALIKIGPSKLKKGNKSRKQSITQSQKNKQPKDQYSIFSTSTSSSSSSSSSSQQQQSQQSQQLFPPSNSVSPTNSPIHSPLQQSVTSPQSPNRLTVSQQSQKPKKKQKVKQKVVKKNKEKDKINDKEKVELKFEPLKIEKKEDPEKKEEAKEEKKEEDEPKEGDKQLPATQRSHESLKSYTSYSSTFTRITTVQNKTLHQQNQIKVLPPSMQQNTQESKPQSLSSPHISKQENKTNGLQQSIKQDHSLSIETNQKRDSTRGSLLAVDSKQQSLLLKKQQINETNQSSLNILKPLNQSSYTSLSSPKIKQTPHSQQSSKNQIPHSSSQSLSLSQQQSKLSKHQDQLDQKEKESKDKKHKKKNKDSISVNSNDSQSTTPSSESSSYSSSSRSSSYSSSSSSSYQEISPQSNQYGIGIGNGYKQSKKSIMKQNMMNINYAETMNSNNMNNMIQMQMFQQMQQLQQMNNQDPYQMQHQQQLQIMKGIQDIDKNFLPFQQITYTRLSHHPFLPVNLRPLIRITQEFKPKSTTLQFLRKEIYQIYGDKLEADKNDRMKGKKSQDICQFIFDYYLYQQNLRQLAENKIVDLIGAVRKYSRYSSRIRLFARFTGMITPQHLDDDPQYAIALASQAATITAKKYGKPGNQQQSSSSQSSSSSQQYNQWQGIMRSGSERELLLRQQQIQQQQQQQQQQQSQGVIMIRAGVQTNVGSITTPQQVQQQQQKDEDENFEDDFDDLNDYDDLELNDNNKDSQGNETQGLDGTLKRQQIQKMKQRRSKQIKERMLGKNGEPKKNGFSLLDEYNEMEEMNTMDAKVQDVEKYRDNIERNRESIEQYLLLDEISPFSFNDTWPSSAVDFGMNILSIVLERGTALALPTLQTADEVWTISVTRALECVKLGFKDMPDTARRNIMLCMQHIGQSGCEKIIIRIK